MSVRCSGTLFVFLAAVLYSTAGLCMKLIPWSGMALNGGRSIIALGVFGAYLLLTRHKPKLNRWVLLGAVTVCGTNVLFALANKMTTAANAIVLQYTAPIFVILLSFVLLKKKPGRLDVAACAVVFLGVVCFFVESLGGGQFAGDLISLISGITYAGLHAELYAGRRSHCVRILGGRWQCAGGAAVYGRFAAAGYGGAHQHVGLGRF